MATAAQVTNAMMKLYQAAKWREELAEATLERIGKRRNMEGRQNIFSEWEAARRFVAAADRLRARLARSRLVPLE